MDTEDAIIPLCLYSNNKSSHIALPEKTREGDSTVYKCTQRVDMGFVMVFYAINPDVKPNPTYTNLIGIKNTNRETVSISSLYDPFNVDYKTSIRCLVWFETTPNTTPLYITTDGSNLYISPYQNQPNPSYTPYKIPIIHVLTNPSENFPKTPHSAGEFQTKKNKPVFTFSNSYGKCIPDPQGNLTLGQCIVLYNKNISNPEYIGKYPNILTYLQTRYGNGKKSTKISGVIGMVFTSILLFAILALLWLKMKKKNLYK